MHHSDINEVRKRFLCKECGMDTLPGEYYMIHDTLWSSANFNYGDSDGMLCIGCVETNIGRRLTRSDFPSCPVNEISDWFRSDRLKDRLRI